jgi:membrane-bound metal-dependent hydrolase YbcI (DUF457 family)
MIGVHSDRRRARRAPLAAGASRAVALEAYLGAATAGYATHGLLDASTTYGTLFFWPFTDMRVAWNAISIVDPLFTLVLLLGVALAVWRKARAQLLRARSRAPSTS